MIQKTLDWMDIDILCYNLHRKINRENFNPDCVIAILRGGLIPARLLEDHFSSINNFHTISAKLYNKDNGMNDRVIIEDFLFDLSEQNVLIVDDIWDSGTTMECVTKKINSSALYPKSIKTATLLCREDSSLRPDYYGELVDKSWIVFPWEKYEHQRYLESR